MVPQGWTWVPLMIWIYFEGETKKTVLRYSKRHRWGSGGGGLVEGWQVTSKQWKATVVVQWSSPPHHVRPGRASFVFCIKHIVASQLWNFFDGPLCGVVHFRSYHISPPGSWTGKMDIILKKKGGRFPRYLVTNLVTNSSPNMVIHQIWWRICHQLCHEVCP